jgi:hypothetical protein
MPNQEQLDDKAVRDATQAVIDRVIDFDDETRRRIFRTALTFYGLDTGLDMPAHSRPQPNLAQTPALHAPAFSERTERSPKEFLFQKQPQTDVERIACLAYYLTHYRDTPHFKTIDISKLNTEAAQVKFSNTAYAVVNAVNTGLLVPAGKGFKQLSHMGERYVEALPDRAAAKEVLTSVRTRTRRKLKNSRQPATIAN